MFTRAYGRHLPIITFAFVWLLQIVLYILNPYGFHDISAATWAVVLSSVFAVLFGYLSYSGLNYLHEVRDQESRIGQYRFVGNLPKIRNVVLLLSFLSFLAILVFFSYLVSQIGGFGQFLSNRLEVRNLIVAIIKVTASEWNIFASLSLYIYNLNYVAILLAGICYAYSGRSSITAFLPLVNALLFSLVTFQRYIFIQSLIFWGFSIFVVSLLDKNVTILALRKFRRLVLVMIPMVLSILLLVIILRIDFGEKEIDYGLTLNYAASSIYAYFSGNIVALDQFLTGTERYYYGGSVFRSFFKWFARFGIVDPGSVIGTHSTFVSIGPLKMNTYTYIRPFYEDLGIFSVLAYSYLWGLVSAISVILVFRRFSLLRLHLAVFLYFSLFISFFNFSMLNITLFLYFGFLVWLIEKVFIRDKLFLPYDSA